MLYYKKNTKVREIVKKILILLLVHSLVGCKAQIEPPIDNDCDDENLEDSCVIDEKEDVETRINEIIENMSLIEKASQMVQAERSSIKAEDLTNYPLGSILSGGGSHPNQFDDNADIWYEMVYAYQEAALNSGASIPILYGVDAIHGHNNLYGATIFPHNIGLGAANDPELVYNISKATAKEMLTTGIYWNFAPALSIVQNISWGRTYEGYSEHPEIFEILTQSAIKGFEENGVSATAKHYIADGATTNGVDQGDVDLSEQELREIHLTPYIEAVKAGVDTVMISYSSIQGKKMHENTYWITTVLKEELDFEGFVVSDWNAIHQLEGSYLDQVTKSINAGIDMLMEPYSWKDAVDSIVAAVNMNMISMERVDDAVSRILKVKIERGLFDEPFKRLDPSYLYNDEHEALAREAVRKSLVLLKNENQVLPLDKNQTIYLTGEASDSVGLMSGGWTTHWQGNTASNIGVGTSILDAFEKVTTLNGGSITNFQDASTVIVVLSEKPYSEGMGDNFQLTLNSHTASPTNLDSLKVAQQAQAEGKNVIGILISGRPLLLEGYLEYFDSFIAAWLPGSEGGNGIADVVFGDYNFTGRLSYTWPKSIEQVGIQSYREAYDESLILFPYGYGLSYE